MAQLSLAQIVAELKAVSAAGRSGVFRITTDNNHTAQFGLDAGRITMIRYRIKRGGDALELVKRVQAGQYNFEEGQDPSSEDTSLPASDAILAELEAAAPSAPPTSPSPAPSSAPSSPAPAAPQGDFSAGARAAFEDALTEHIGPMAGIVCRNVLAQASDIGEAIEMMKAKIPDPARAEQFERDVTSRTLA